jgi:hypothetical protein
VRGYTFSDAVDVITGLTLFVFGHSGRYDRAL